MTAQEKTPVPEGTGVLLVWVRSPADGRYESPAELLALVAETAAVFAAPADAAAGLVAEEAPAGAEAGPAEDAAALAHAASDVAARAGLSVAEPPAGAVAARCGISAPRRAAAPEFSREAPGPASRCGSANPKGRGCCRAVHSHAVRCRAVRCQAARYQAVRCRGDHTVAPRPGGRADAGPRDVAR
jgi:hypothetical protein